MVHSDGDDLYDDDDFYEDLEDAIEYEDEKTSQTEFQKSWFTHS